LIFDENGALIETLKNPFMGAGDGAGLGVVKMLEDKRITAVVAERFGVDMIDTMEKWRIDHYQMKGAILESISRIKDE
jgi:predicted Fe-Mo cluster-binding NifX family protein